jgi:hypothetical protein
MLIRTFMHLLRLPHIDSLTVFGLTAVSLMLVFYALENRSRHFTLLFAGACVMGSAYGFMQGAWPFGLVEGVWSLVAIRKWSQLRSSTSGALESSQDPHASVAAFLEDVLAQARRAGPTTYAFPDGFVQIYRPRPGRILIHRLWATSPGNRAGSEILRTLCDLADLHEVEIVLRALPFGDKPYPMSVEQLAGWYRRYGFAGPVKRMLRKPRVEIEFPQELNTTHA